MSTRTRSVVRRCLVAVGVAGGATALGVALGAGAASADETSGQDGLLSGNQSEVAVEVPVDVSGNQVTVIGDGNTQQGSTTGSGSSGSGGAPEARSTTGEDGAASGNQSELQVDAPVDVSGNQVTVIGDGNEAGGSTESASSAPAAGSGAGSGAGSTSGEDGLLSGTQSAVGAHVPVDVCGNQVTVVGDGNESAGCAGSGSSAPAEHAGSGDSTSGEDGVGSGNQTGLAAVVPAEASGNQVTVIGDGNESAGATDAGGTDGVPADGGGDSTSGEDGVGSGNQTGLAAVVPVEVSGNQVTVIGDGNESAGATGAGGTGGVPADGGGDSTSGEDGVGSGNQTPLVVAVPLEASGHQVTIVGDGNQSGGDEDVPPTAPGAPSPPTSAGGPGDPGTPGGPDTPGEGGDAGEQVAPAFGGGPGHPGTVAPAEALPTAAAAPSVGILPATGAGGSLVPVLLGLVLLMGGLVLLRPSRGSAKGGASRV